jgi:hypothetical protein
MKNVSYKSCRETQNTHFTIHNFLFENHVIYEIMWKNIVGWGRPHDNMVHAHRMQMPKPKNTHIGCITLIAFSLQQCLHKPASILHYMYTACLALFDLV